jgi:mono/diheme cytochrome c family protein
VFETDRQYDNLAEPVSERCNRAEAFCRRGNRAIRIGSNAGAAVVSSVLFLLLVFPAFAAPASKSRSAAPVDFSREILPIFSENCIQCHGPDEKARKAKLRFDTKEGAFRVSDGKSVIVPGKSAESELVRRITTTDPDDHMPPPKSNHKLTANQIKLLTRWIDEGAKWGVHWAFNPIASPNPPSVKNKKWPVNDIDRFVLARLEQEGLTPSPPADKERLLRRITFDLTGLPPTPAELDAFLADRSPAAYEKVVDRLLASPRFGERMAVPWLDLARYADTYGYQYDAPRPVWPYRDWVIKAFNENMPFDQFVTWQLAGDLLPNATREQRLATAFNRLHLQNEEGGVVGEEFRVSYVVDRVDTFGAAFLGLTVDCSRCHDHKFDPITMRDFYSLFACFQNIDESGQNPFTGFVDYNPTPTLLLSDAATDAQLAKLSKEIAAKESQQQSLRGSARSAFDEWLKNRASEPAIPGLIAAFSFDEIKDGKITNSVDLSKPGNAHEGPQLVEGKSGKAALLNGDNGFTFPGLGHFTRADPFSIALWLQPATYAARQVILHHSKAPEDAGSRGYEILLEDGRVAVGLHHQWPGDSLKVRTRTAIPTNSWTHVAFAYDGSSRAAGLHVFLNGAPAEVEIIREKLRKDLTYAAGEPELAIGYRFRDSGFKSGKVEDLRIFDRALTSIEVADIAGLDDLRTAWNSATARSLSLSPSDGERAGVTGCLFDYFFANFYPPEKQLSQELTTLRRDQAHTINAIPELMVMDELPSPKPAHILKRGAYDAPADEVSADTPHFLSPLPKGAPRNRLGLARWLLAPENPLMSRVTVNRAWQLMFGRGIVETSEDFGTRGSPPSHPELLDWLACGFMASGWNQKALLKKIAMSATYRQSSKAAPDLLARDPDNKLLARGPARRLSAEMLRDQALFASGLLAEKIGGPSVRPYQPPGLWEIAMGNPKYEQGHGDDLHRRSLYSFWKRTVPPPAMLSFDAPERNVCAIRRQTTSTPLQALGLLNDIQITEAARLLSQRMLKQGGPLDRQIPYAFRLATSRRPTTREIAILEKLFKEQRDLFSLDQPAATKLLAVGETSNDSTLSPADLAAGAVLAEAMLNHDEAIMRR